jgi:hypothetical protein
MSNRATSGARYQTCLYGPVSFTRRAGVRDEVAQVVLTMTVTVKEGEMSDRATSGARHRTWPLESRPVEAPARFGRGS